MLKKIQSLPRFQRNIIRWLIVVTFTLVLMIVYLKRIKNEIKGSEIKEWIQNNSPKIEMPEMEIPTTEMPNLEEEELEQINQIIEELKKEK